MSAVFENFNGVEGELEQVVGSAGKIERFASEEPIMREQASMTATSREPVQRNEPEEITSKFDKDQIIGIGVGVLLTLAGVVGIGAAFIVTLGLPVIPIIGITMPVISAKLFGALLAGSFISAGIGVATFVFSAFK